MCVYHLDYALTSETTVYANHDIGIISSYTNKLAYF